MHEADPESPLPMVLLRHTMPAGAGGGASHFDWLLGRCTIEEARRSPDTRDAVTIRLSDSPACRDGDFRGDDIRGDDIRGAERLPDHRRLYLWFEGELSQGRGRVERIATGLWWGLEADAVGRDDGTLRFRARFEGEPRDTNWELGACGLVRVPG